MYMCMREREAKERKFRITKCRIPLKKGEFEYLVQKEFYASLANVEIVCDPGKYVLRM